MFSKLGINPAPPNPVGCGTLVSAPPPPPPAPVSGFVDFILATFAKPAATIPAAEIAPNIPPCARALLAPVYVSINACAIANYFPALLFSPNAPDI